MSTVSEEPVLCPALHRQLVLRFGHVTVANPGCSFVGHMAVDPQTGRPALNVSDAGEYYRVNCPRCRDTRRRLWISHLYGQAEEGKRPFNFMVVCFNENCFGGATLQAVANRAWLEDTLLGQIPRSQRRQILTVLPGRKQPREYHPPGHVIPLHTLGRRHPANAYLIDRGFEPYRLSEQYGLGYCHEAVEPYAHTASNRLIIPLVDQGKPVGWQARYIGDCDWKATGRKKYYNMHGTRKSDMFYGFDRSRSSRLLVLVEGVTNVWRLGTGAIGSLGNSISAHQQELLGQWIRQHSGKPLALACAFDRDPVKLDNPRATAAAQESAIKVKTLIARVNDSLAKSGGSAFQVEMPIGVDCADMTREAAWQFIYEAFYANGLDPAHFLDRP